MLFITRLLLLFAFLPVAASAQEQGGENVSNSTELILHARTGEYHLSPPSVGVKIRVSYQAPTGPEREWMELAVKVVETDSKGMARCVLELPAPENANKPVEGRVDFEVISPGWVGLKVDGDLNLYFPILYKSDIHYSWRGPSEQPEHVNLIIPPGALVKVRAVGTEEQTSKWNRFYADLEVRHLESVPLGAPNLQVDSRVFLRGNDWKAGPSGIFSFAEKGHYEIMIRGSDGVGRIASIELDPMDPPEEIEIPIEEFDTISGRISNPHYWGAVFYVRAIAKDEVIGSFPVVSAEQQAAHYPPHYADYLVTDKDQDPLGATFKIAGLAPGEYRLGLFMHHTLFLDSSAFTDADVVAWFDHPAVATGSTDIELTVPTSTLRLKFLDPDGNVISNLKELGYGANAILVNPKGLERFEWGQRNSDGEFVLFAGHRYRLIAYGPGLPVVEYEVIASKAGTVMELPISLDASSNGKLSWTGPWESMHYEILSSRFGIRLAELNTNNTQGDLSMERELPPGRYLVRATGLTQVGADGQLYEELTPYGTEEIWVDIQADETTKIDFDPPLVGRIKVNMKATGQPFPDPRTSFKDGLVLMDPLTGKSWPLSFEGRTYLMEEDYLRPGQKKRCPQGFSGGIYQLQINIPGFPPQQQQVVIKAGLITEVQITLKGS